MITTEAKHIYVGRMQYMGCGYVINEAGKVSHDVSRAMHFPTSEAAHDFANRKNWTHDVSVREGCTTYYLSDVRLPTPVEGNGGTVGCAIAETTHANNCQ